MNKIIPILFIIIFFGCSTITKKSEPLKVSKELQIVTRADWGWKPLEKTPPEHEIQYITIHHGGVMFTKDKDPAEYLRHLQDWSRSERSWIDIPYHFMIDLDGIVYEARPLQYPGDTNTNYDPTGHALICLMGNYEVQTVSEIQLKSIIDLSAWLAKKYSVSVERIKSHKDYTETACPGADLYRYLENGYIVREIKKQLSSLPF